MQIPLIRKQQAFMVALSAGLTLLNPVFADEKKGDGWIDVGISEDLKKISIKKIRTLGDKEFSYQNEDNNIILVRCKKGTILVRYWYFTKVGIASTKEATSKMQWHRPSPKSQTQLESEFVCSYKNS